MRCITRFLLHEELGEEARHQDAVKKHQNAKARAWLGGFASYPGAGCELADEVLADCWRKGRREAEDRAKGAV